MQSEIQSGRNEMIVGFLTQSNQFVKLINVIPNDFVDEIETKPGYDYFDIDKHQNDESIDPNSEPNKFKFIQFMRLEKEFYNTYTNEIKNILHNERNIDVLQHCENDTRSIN